MTMYFLHLLLSSNDRSIHFIIMIYINPFSIRKITGFSFWQEKSKFTNFQRPQINHSFFTEVQSLENGRSVPPKLSKIFKDRKNYVIRSDGKVQ